MADLSNLSSILHLTDPSLADPATLAALRQYDPSATYVYNAPEYSSEGGLSHSGGYTLSFDPSKLPGAFGSQSIGEGYHTTNDVSNRGYEWQGPTFENVTDENRSLLKDPSKVSNDSHYGTISPAGNMNRPNDSSWLDYAPLIVAGMGFAAPALLGGYAVGAGAAGFADPFLAGGTGAMDMTGSAGTGIAGSGGYAGTGAMDMMGSAGTGLSGMDVAPGGAMDMTGSAGTGLPGSTGLETTGGLTQAQWDEIIAGQPENGSFVGPDGTDPNGFTPGDYRDLEAFNAGLDNPSLLDRLTNALKDPSNLSKIPGLLGSGTGAGAGAGGGGGGGNLLINAGGQQQKPQVEDAAAILARLYGQGGLLGAKRNG